MTSIEFSIVAIPFLGLLAAIFESALVYFANQGVSAAVEHASRAIMTGQVQSNGAITSAKQFRDALICNGPTQALLPSFVDCSKIIVDVRTAQSFSAADTADDFYSDMDWTYCTGGPGDIVVVRATYPMPVYFSIVEATPNGVGTNNAGQVQYNGGWTHMVMGVSTFRNEPFMTYAGPGPSC